MTQAKTSRGDAMRKLALATLFMVGISMIFVPSYASDPCLGSKGDSTFTLQELLDLITVVQVKSNDSHKNHYRAVWLCKNSPKVNLTLKDRDLRKLALFTSEELNLDKTYDEELSKKSLLHGTTSIRLTLEVVGLEKKITLDGREVRVNLSVYVDLAESRSYTADGAAAYKEQRSRFDLVRRAIQQSRKDGFQMTLTTQIGWLHESGEICPLRGEVDAYNSIHFNVPESVSINGNRVW